MASSDRFRYSETACFVASAIFISVRPSRYSVDTLKKQAGYQGVGELVFDVNTVYFKEQGGYEHAKQFSTKPFTMPKKRYAWITYCPQ